MATFTVTEGKMRARFERALLERYLMRVSVEKLHGSVYQTGLPDVLLLWHTGELLLIEYKVGEPRTVGAVFGMLHGRQKLIIGRLGVRRAHAWVLVRKREERDDSEPCWALVSAFDLAMLADTHSQHVEYRTLSDTLDVLAASVTALTHERARRSTKPSP